MLSSLQVFEDPVLVNLCVSHVTRQLDVPNIDLSRECERVLR